MKIVILLPNTLYTTCLLNLLVPNLCVHQKTASCVFITHSFVCLYIGIVFFLSGSPPIHNWSPNQILGTPSFGAQKGPFKVPPAFLGLAVRILQILNCADMPGIMSTSSIMPFNNVDQHWCIDFLKVNKFGLAEARGRIIFAY